MSLRTCSWLLPQNEQRYGTLVPLLPLVVLTRCPRSRFEVAAPPGSTPGSGLRLLVLLGPGSRRCAVRLRRLGGLGDAGALTAGESGVVGRCDQRGSLEVVDRIDDAIVLCLTGAHEPVPLRVLDHGFERLAGVPRENPVVQVNERLPLLHLDQRVHRRAAEAAGAVVDHDPAAREAVAPARGAG